MTKFIKTEDID